MKPKCQLPFPADEKCYGKIALMRIDDGSEDAVWCCDKHARLFSTLKYLLNTGYEMKRIKSLTLTQALCLYKLTKEKK